MQNEPNTTQAPFQIDVADRVKRLPPYLFGKINDLKYRKRRAGVDVIDLGMGNPTDVPEPKVLILNFPHNPTATVIERDFFVDVVALARRFGFMVIHDFAYGDVCFDGYRAPSFLSVPGAKEVGVETTTMSKGFNMAGWRIGFCAGNREMVRALATIKGYYDYGIFQAVQIAGILALRQGEEVVDRQAAEYQHRRDVLVDGLQRIGWEVGKPKASMFVWARYPAAWRERMDSMDFEMKLLEEAVVAVSPGRGFGEA